MSNIPFNTVASVLATTAASRQVAATNSRRTQEALRAEQVRAQTSVRHMEEIEDLDEKAVDLVGDEQEKRNQQDHRKRRKEEPEEKVELSGKATEKLGSTSTLTTKPTGKSVPAKPSLDISA